MRIRKSAVCFLPLMLLLAGFALANPPRAQASLDACESRGCVLFLGECWCRTTSTFQTGGQRCGHGPNFAGSYYSVTGVGSADGCDSPALFSTARPCPGVLGTRDTSRTAQLASKFGLLAGGTEDCATNLALSGTLLAASLECWDNAERWQRTGTIVRCTNFECGNGQIHSPETCDEGFGTGGASGSACTEECSPTPCGAPVSKAADGIVTSDALFALRSAVGLESCNPRVCDLNRDLRVTTSDALTILQLAVGLDRERVCSNLFDITFRALSESNLKAVQAEVDYLDAPGEFVGSGSSVVCQQLVSDEGQGKAYSNNALDEFLFIAQGTTAAFNAGGRNYVRCRFEASPGATPLVSDFQITEALGQLAGSENTVAIDVSISAIEPVGCDTCPKTVFVTRAKFDGNLGTIAGADRECQNAARSASLPGRYLAWLADDTDTPAKRFSASAGPYQGVDGVVIANDWLDLTDGTLLARIRLDEFGDAIPDADNVWTNVSQDGGLDPDTQHCSNWNSIVGQGNVGQNSATDHRWTVEGSEPCSGSGNRTHLYCFQQ